MTERPAARLPDIVFFEDVFDPSFCRLLLEDARKALREGTGFSRSNFHWDAAIVRASQPVLVRDCPEAISRFVLAGLRQRGVIEDDAFHVMTYAWTRLSYIPWHTDRKHGTAITLYLNEVWDADWGGLFLYKDREGDIRGYAPRFNTGLRNDAALSHSTTPVTLDASEPRFTLQLFGKSEGEHASLGR